MYWNLNHIGSRRLANKENQLDMSFLVLTWSIREKSMLVTSELSVYVSYVLTPWLWWPFRYKWRSVGRTVISVDPFIQFWGIFDLPLLSIIMCPNSIQDSSTIFHRFCWLSLPKMIASLWLSLTSQLRCVAWEKHQIESVIDVHWCSMDIMITFYPFNGHNGHVQWTK